MADMVEVPREHLSAEQFARDYAARSGVPLAELLQYRHVVECGDAWGCDDPDCPGWAMVPLDCINTRGIDALGNAVVAVSDG